MFKHYKTVVVCLLVLGTSCKKSFLDTRPTDAVSAANGITTTSEGAALINGMHRSLYTRYNAQGEGGQGAIMINMDVLGEDLVFTAQANNWYIAQYRWIDHRNANGSIPYFFYQFYYQLIANANLLINSIDKASGPAAEKATIKAEALTYRAWAYYGLVQVFGKRYEAGNQNTQPGVPLVLEETTEAVARATVADVYAQINKDLDAAIAAFGSGGARNNKSHFDVNVAKGVKARVALTQGQWSDAAKFAAEARTGFTLMSNAQYLEGFNNITNPEWLWGMDMIDEQGIFFAHFFAYMSSNYNSTNIRTNPKQINRLVYDQLPATDVRRQVWDPTGTTIPASLLPPGGLRRPYMTRKFLAQSQSSSVADLPLMRAAELYLIEAEAKARSGDEAGARAALFTLVNNRNASYTLSTNTGTALVNEILFHRRVELWGEGFRFTDLKRLNQPLNRNGANHNTALALILDVPAGDKQWEFVFPQTELNANAKLVQNPL